MILSEHVWKIGDWCDWNGRRYFVVRDYQLTLFVVNSDMNIVYTIPSEDAVHLPDCDSWTWQPPATLQLKEGCWYERRDGEIVGPCKVYHGNGVQRWIIDGETYYTDGHWNVQRSCNYRDLIREVPAPVPKYRQFRDDEAYEHCGKVLKGKNGGWGRALVVCVNDDDTIVIGDENVRQRYAFEHYTFEDDSPFGVKVDE